MQNIKISYDPYKMVTKLWVNGIDVCTRDEYGRFRELFETHTPLQTWIEPISYKKWAGIINELKSDEEGYEKFEFHFSGREIDFEDFKRACEIQNSNRQYELGLEFFHDTVLSDKKLAQNIDVIMQSLLSDRFADRVKEQGKDSSVYLEYKNLKYNYELAKKRDFKIVFAGLYSSGKSTIINSLIRHNILPTSDETCTSKTCRIRHKSNFKSKISIECFDKEGNVVVNKQTFSDDDSCLKKFWEITPLNSNKSVPETVDTIELCVDLSHLYPSKDMEKIFNLVIIDTPGSNSTKKTHLSVDGANNEGFGNDDKKIALDAINGVDREMVVICADAQDYEDDSVGVFLKAIHEESNDNIGDFNDRFLFALNKCDNLKYNDKESINDRKDGFAQYLMNTERWEIKESGLNYVPRIFMLSAYNYLAVLQGAPRFTKEELRENRTKRNMLNSYEAFRKNVIDYEDSNYYLSQACDIPDYLKKKYMFEYANSVETNEDEAIAIQTGMCSLEKTIQDYIARYAYPLKVKRLIETFDLILDSVRDYSDEQGKILEERVQDLGKNTSEREEVKTESVKEEKKISALDSLRKLVEEEQKKINNIQINMRELQEVRREFDQVIEMDECVRNIRKAHDGESLEWKDMKIYVDHISEIFHNSADAVNHAFKVIAEEYKDKINEICINLNDISSQLENYNISGLKFSSSLTLKKMKEKDHKELAQYIKDHSDTIKVSYTVETKNRIKDERYKFYQIGKKIKQYFAPEKILVEKERNEYEIDFLKRYLNDASVDFREHCRNAEEVYVKSIEEMKNSASSMIGTLECDIREINGNLNNYKSKIESLGESITALEEEIKQHEKTKQWLEGLANRITMGGEVSE